MKGIIWLASYPKSGNTWFRTLIANLMSKSQEPVDINQLSTGGIASGRERFDELTGIESGDLTFEEINRLRPEVYEYLAQTVEKPLFVKVHDAYTYLSDGRPLLPSENCKAIYLIRNPLDVAVSFSHHLRRDLDTTIERMGDSTFCFCAKPDRMHNQLRQQLLTWSEHVESWVDAPGLAVHVVRYEDLKAQPLETFTQAINFLGLAVEEEQIRRAVEFSDFKVLKKQEEEKGFREKPPGMPAFFREGKTESWKERLTEEQVEKIINQHRRIMERFHYL